MTTFDLMVLVDCACAVRAVRGLQTLGFSYSKEQLYESLDNAVRFLGNRELEIKNNTIKEK